MILFPEVQKKAQAEIDAVVGTGRLPIINDRDALPYVSSVVKEVLRWRPVVPMGASVPPSSFPAILEHEFSDAFVPCSIAFRHARRRLPRLPHPSRHRTRRQHLVCTYPLLSISTFLMADAILFATVGQRCTTKRRTKTQTCSGPNATCPPNPRQTAPAGRLALGVGTYLPLFLSLSIRLRHGTYWHIGRAPAKPSHMRRCSALSRVPWQCSTSLKRVMGKGGRSSRF